MSANTATDTREQLKKDILDYLVGLGVKDTAKLKEACAFIKEVADRFCDADEEYDYWLSKKFSPVTRPTIKKFILRLEALNAAELEQEMEEEFTLGGYLEEQRQNRFREEYEYEYVEGEVIITPDRIEVQAIGFVEGFKDALPKGGKYQGKGTWYFPLSARALFGNGAMWRKCAILFHPNCK